MALALIVHSVKLNVHNEQLHFFITNTFCEYEKLKYMKETRLLLLFP